MRKTIVLVCIALQLLFLLSMVYSRESIVYTGERIVLRTSPVDPRDPFRGDYVRLQFPINNARNHQVKWAADKDKPIRGDKVYAVLVPTIGGVHEADYMTNERPVNGELFITGEMLIDWEELKNLNPLTLRTNIKFGIEQLFVEQGEGRSIENRQGFRGGIQVPMLAEVAVNSNGVAVLDGYHWSPLGVNIIPDADALLASGNDGSLVDAQGRAFNPHLKVDVINVSDNMVRVSNPSDHCGFTIEPAEAFHSDYEQATACTEKSEVSTWTLAPNESMTLKVNLLEERWFVKPKLGDMSAARAVDTNEMVRFVYRSSVAMSNEVGKEVWLGEVSSRAISMRGRID